jgi:hypothetical protein
VAGLSLLLNSGLSSTNSNTGASRCNPTHISDLLAYSQAGHRGVQHGVIAMSKKPTVSISKRNDLAVSLAHKISEATMSDMTGLMESNEEVQRGPLVIYVDLLRDLSRDTLLTIPVIDSVNPDTGPSVTNNPDGYYINKSLANGGNKDVRAWWHNDFADSTSTGLPIVIYDRPKVVGGVEIDAVLDEIKKKMADEMTKPADKKDLEVERSYWQNRKSRNRTIYTKGFRVFQKLEDMKVLDGFNCTIIPEDKASPVDKGGLPTTAKKCIKIQNVTDGEDYRIWTLQTFLNCDPVLAKASGGTLDALDETVSKDSSDADEDQAEPLKLNGLELELQRMSALLSQKGMGELLKHMCQKKETGPIFAHIFVDVAMEMQEAMQYANMRPLWKQIEDEAGAEAA